MFFILRQSDVLFKLNVKFNPKNVNVHICCCLIRLENELKKKWNDVEWAGRKFFPIKMCNCITKFEQARERTRVGQSKRDRNQENHN